MNVQTSQLVAMLLGSLLPVLTGWVSHQTASSRTRAVLLVLLSAAAGVGTDFVASVNGGPAFDLKAAALGALVAFVTGVATHFGFWKPAGVSDKVVALPGFVGRKES